MPDDQKKTFNPESIVYQLALCSILTDITLFTTFAGIALRNYQAAVARAVVESVFNKKGLSFVVMFPRQSGKNELQAHLEAYLLMMGYRTGVEIVKISPTWKPQSENAMHRLERVLAANELLKGAWRKENGYIFRMGQASITFLSGSPEAHIVGATAATLLEVDEAQDILTGKYDKEIAPMAASTNATRVFWGTAWTGRTLLARELRAARAAEVTDGQRRVFRLSAREVSLEAPAYADFVAEQVARLGRDHPMVKTQFFSEEIEAEAGMFPPERQALMAGEHARRTAPAADGAGIYALLLDVAGEDESASDRPGAISDGDRRDSTALTVVEVDLATLADPGLRAPCYRVLDRRLWTGVKHSALYGQVRALAELWRARQVVVDATGVGAGLASFLERALPGRVIPFVFSSASKSQLGWDFLAACDAGRFKDWKPGGRSAGDAERWRAIFWRQVEYCQYSVREGPGRSLAWGVPDGTRDPATGEQVHDDLLLSAALCAVLDRLEWYEGGAGGFVPGRDPLEEMDGGF